MVQFYNLLFLMCMNSMIDNGSVVKTLLPEHQQAWIIQGAARACREELKHELELACIEAPELCPEQ